MDLCLAIESVFFALSNFSQAHQLLVDNQVGAVTLEVIDLELQRADHREEVGRRSAMLMAGWSAGRRWGLWGRYKNAMGAWMLLLQSTQRGRRVLRATA